MGEETKSAGGGSQTLLRGLDVLEACADGPILLAALADRLGLTRSTAHRLANALIERRYLTMIPRRGYALGPELLKLGFLAQRQTDIVQTARPHLEDLANATDDTVHLGVLDGDRALYLDKIAGQRRVEIRSRVGDRHPLTSTGLGKALLIDDAPPLWLELFDQQQEAGGFPVDRDAWLGKMRDYARSGHAFDLEENEDSIRCVAAPVRDAGGRIVAAISVSSAAQYMDDARMQDLVAVVRGAADGIARDLGWAGK